MGDTASVCKIAVIGIILDYNASWYFLVLNNERHIFKEIEASIVKSAGVQTFADEYYYCFSSYLSSQYALSLTCFRHL